MKNYLLLILLIGAFNSGKASYYEERLFKETMDFVHECGSSSLSLCLKEKTLKYIERLPSDIDVGGGMRIRQNDVERLPRQYTPLPEESAAREDILDELLFERIADYLSTHTFEFQLPSEAVKDMKMSVEEGRKRKGDGGGNNRNKGMMFMLFQVKALTLGAIALKLVGLIALKALFVAKVAFTIASVIALKKLLESKHHTSTYEVVGHPHAEDYGHFDRAFNPELAYKGQQQPINHK